MNPGGWYCFTCDSTPKEQLEAVRRVEKMRYQVFCPTRTEWRSANKFEKTRRRKELKQYAVFPGYIFIRMWRPQLAPFFREQKPDAIYAVLSRNGEPLICDDDIIQEQAALHGQQIVPDAYKYFQTGHELEVGEGAIYAPLGIEVVVQEISGEKVSVEPVQAILGSTKPINVEAWELRKAG